MRVENVTKQGKQKKRGNKENGENLFPQLQTEDPEENSHKFVQCVGGVIFCPSPAE